MGNFMERAKISRSEGRTVSRDGIDVGCVRNECGSKYICSDENNQPVAEIRREFGRDIVYGSRGYGMPGKEIGELYPDSDIFGNKFQRFEPKGGSGGCASQVDSYSEDNGDEDHDDNAERCPECDSSIFDPMKEFMEYVLIATMDSAQSAALRNMIHMQKSAIAVGQKRTNLKRIRRLLSQKVRERLTIHPSTCFIFICLQIPRKKT
jgi:hypothetical protein